MIPHDSIPHFRQAMLSAVLCLCMPGAMAAETAPHWGYDQVVAPAQWTAMAPACGGNLQSPIDLWSGSIKHGAEHQLSTDYDYASFEVINNGHTLQATPRAGKRNHIDIEGERFDLVQFHVHTPSEHHVDGKEHAMELHLVHANEAGKIAVVGVFFDVGARNEALGELFSRIPAELGQPGSTVTLYSRINPEKLLPEQSRVVRYTGSLTTPPCSEGVLWNMEMTPKQISQEQLDALRHVYPHNARPIQQFNTRTLTDQPAAP